LNDICKLTHFKPVRSVLDLMLYVAEKVVQVIGTLRGIIAFMNKSNYATEFFDYYRHKLGIRRGLETIGETRFGTFYWSGESVLRGLPALKMMIEDDDLQIEVPVCLSNAIRWIR
jgi:hypothetical protein